MSKLKSTTYCRDDYARHVVRDAKPLELALLVKLVDSLERDFVRDLAVGTMQVPHVKAAVSTEVVLL